VLPLSFTEHLAKLFISQAPNDGELACRGHELPAVPCAHNTERDLLRISLTLPRPKVPTELEQFLGWLLDVYPP